MSDLTEVELKMELASLPPSCDIQLPARARFRAFGRSGDIERWQGLQDAVYGALPANLFLRDFGQDTRAHRDRIVFVEVDGTAVGVSAAWHGEDAGPSWGRIHWVAVSPAWQRRGLGRALVLWSLQRLAELGCTAAYLTTGSANLPAIRLYRQLGFTPSPRDEREQRAWQLLAAESA